MVSRQDIISSEQEIEVGREEIIRVRDIIRARDRGGQRGYHQSKR